MLFGYTNPKKATAPVINKLYSISATTIASNENSSGDSLIKQLLAYRYCKLITKKMM
jgi:hypothetical protein